MGLYVAGVAEDSGHSGPRRHAESSTLRPNPKALVVDLEWTFSSGPNPNSYPTPSVSRGPAENPRVGAGRDCGVTDPTRQRRAGAPA